MPTRLLLLSTLLAACGSAPAPDASLGGEDAARPPADAPGSEDAGVSDASADAATPGCVERNSSAEIAARGGFVEVCAPADQPRAVCGDGSPYRFSYRRAEGASAGLLVYFRGGGNCTDYVSCWGTDGMGGTGRRVSTLENERSAPEVIPSLGRSMGFFDQVDPTALFADFDIVYASYCSGDGGLQSTEETFARPPEADPSAPASITTYFRGVDNRRVVVAAAAALFPSPARLVVAGSSAGSFAAMGAVPELVGAFAAVEDVTYYGEGGIGVGRSSFDALVEETISAHDGEGGRPLVRFVHFSFDADETQRQYAPPPFTGDPAAFRAELLRVVAAREAAHPRNYRSLVWSGTCHTVGNSVALYQAFENVGGRWAPVMPAVRPNPELVEGDVSLVDAIRDLTRGSGPLTLDSVTPSEVGTGCGLPGR